jgi:hypothetical protein
MFIYLFLLLFLIYAMLLFEFLIIVVLFYHKNIKYFDYEIQ